MIKQSQKEGSFGSLALSLHVKERQGLLTLPTCQSHLREWETRRSKPRFPKGVEIHCSWLNSKLAHGEHPDGQKWGAQGGSCSFDLAAGSVTCSANLQAEVPALPPAGELWLSENRTGAQGMAPVQPASQRDAAQGPLETFWTLEDSSQPR